MDQALIERIVNDVLAQLQPPVAVRPVTPAAAAEVHLHDAVITADVLQERLQAGQVLRIGSKSILTPTARDWLRERKIRWQRAGRHSAPAAGGSIRRQLLIATVTPAVRTLREALPRELPGWKHELLGRPIELANAAVRAISTAEADLVVAISDAADVVVCRANRNSTVRAAAPTSAEHLRLLAEHLGPNVLVINPRGRTFVELRNLLRGCAALPAPRPPKDWD
jgi:hypothetical protein